MAECEVEYHGNGVLTIGEGEFPANLITAPESNVTRIVFTGPAILPPNHNSPFPLFLHLKHIEGIEFLDVSNVTDLSYFFQLCHVESLDLSSWDVSNVTDMSYMFNSSFSIKSLNVTGWDTQNLTTMHRMFESCESLNSIVGLELLNTSNVTDMYGMFSECFSLEHAGMSGWDTRNVTNMDGMFYRCPVGEAWKDVLEAGGLDALREQMKSEQLVVSPAIEAAKAAMQETPVLAQAAPVQSR